jgi:hypothetical protein
MNSDTVDLSTLDFWKGFNWTYWLNRFKKPMIELEAVSHLHTGIKITETEKFSLGPVQLNSRFHDYVQATKNENKLFSNTAAQLIVTYWLDKEGWPELETAKLNFLKNPPKTILEAKYFTIVHKYLKKMYHMWVFHFRNRESIGTPYQASWLNNFEPISDLLFQCLMVWGIADIIGYDYPPNTEELLKTFILGRFGGTPVVQVSLRHLIFIGNPIDSFTDLGNSTAQGAIARISVKAYYNLFEKTAEIDKGFITIRA